MHDLDCVGKVSIDRRKIERLAQHREHRDPVAHRGHGPDDVVGADKTGAKTAQRHLVLDEQDAAARLVDRPGKQVGPAVRRITKAQRVAMLLEEDAVRPLDPRLRLGRGAR